MQTGVTAAAPAHPGQRPSIAEEAEVSLQAAAGSVDCCAVAYPSPGPDCVTAPVWSINLEESGEPKHHSLNSCCFQTTFATSGPQRAKLSSGTTEDLHHEGSLGIRNAGH